MTYEKNGQTLIEFNQFLYLEEIYVSQQNSWKLFRSKNYTSKNLLNKQDERVYSTNLGCYVQRYWELIGAPKDYLISQGFKPKL